MEFTFVSRWIPRSLGQELSGTHTGCLEEGTSKMKTHRVAVVGLSADAAHAFQSMLAIVAPRSCAAWVVSEPENADALMAGGNADPALVERWARTDKPLIAVHEQGPFRALSPFCLQHPFRVMQLLTVFDDVAHALAASPAGRATPPPGRAWAFADSLRQIARRPAQGVVYRTGSAADPLYVRDDGRSYWASAALVDRIRSGRMSLPGLEPGERGPGERVDGTWHAGVELAWWTGWWAPLGLAPWLEPEGIYRLRRWPDFGRVPGAQAGVSLCALLGRGGATRDMLSERAGRPLPEIDRFLNAASLAGCVAWNAAPAAWSAPRASLSSRWGSLLRGLRDRLGLAA